jgi:capsule polysaccharide export protein KpsE/RkpR
MPLRHPEQITADSLTDRGLVLYIIRRLDHLEDLMADLDPALDRLEASVDRVRAVVESDVPALRSALDAERAANAELVRLAQETAASEDAEDAAQNEELARVTAQRDAAEAETDSALTRIEGAAGELDSLGAGAGSGGEGEQPQG